MLKKIPITGTPIGFLDPVRYFLFSDFRQDYFKKALKEFLSSDYLFLCNSGIGAFYLILKAIKHILNKNEVILPAYTASVLILPILKLKLKPILCDISLEDFNVDVDKLTDLVSQNTLAILGVHMFGILIKDLDKSKEKSPEVFIIEDCAQSFGSCQKGSPSLNLGEVGFFSFNRGKNLSTYGGGCITTNNNQLAKEIERAMENLKEENLFFKLLIPFKLLALSLIIKPYLYGLFYPLVSKFKKVSPYKDSEVKKYTDFQASVGVSILNRIEEFSKIRYYNGMKLIEGLKDIEDIILPKISEDTQPAFLRLPIVFKNLKKMETIEKKLWRAGIETSRMYLRPLHHIFELDYRKNEFPNAVYLSERLLTLPVHPLVSQDTIDRIISIFKDL